MAPESTSSQHYLCPVVAMTDAGIEKKSAFPYYDLTTGKLRTASPKASESQRIRVTRQGLRDVLATGLEIEVRSLWPFITHVISFSSVAKNVCAVGKSLPRVQVK